MIIGVVNQLVRKILNSDRTVVFVSHPYSSNPDTNKRKVHYICKQLHKEGYFPLSPLHLFSFMEDDKSRSLILLICKLLIAISDKALIYDYGKLSEGQEEELFFCARHAIDYEFKVPPKESDTMNLCNNCNRICDTRCDIDRWNEILPDFSLRDARYYTEEGLPVPSWLDGEVTDEKEFIVTECERKQGLRI